MNHPIQTKLYVFCIILCTWLFSSLTYAQTTIDLETGPIFTGYNDVRIPGDRGTTFSLKDDLKAETKVFYRVRASHTINTRHTLSLLYAPLEIKSSGRVDRDLLFRDVHFDANTPIEGIYKFNSYRLTYRYTIVNQSNVVLGMGFTGKIRDAKISLSTSDLYAEKLSIGFVPIINFRLWWKMSDAFSLVLDGDALGAPQGRAADVQVAVTYDWTDAFRVRLGYRVLEGGADNDTVYGFALFHYASLGLSYSF